MSGPLVTNTSVITSAQLNLVLNFFLTGSSVSSSSSLFSASSVTSLLSSRDSSVQMVSQVKCFYLFTRTVELSLLLFLIQ